MTTQYRRGNNNKNISSAPRTFTSPGPWPLMYGCSDCELYQLERSLEPMVVRTLGSGLARIPRRPALVGRRRRERKGVPPPGRPPGNKIQVRRRAACTRRPPVGLLILCFLPHGSARPPAGHQGMPAALLSVLPDPSRPRQHGRRPARPPARAWPCCRAHEIVQMNVEPRLNLSPPLCAQAHRLIMA